MDNNNEKELAELAKEFEEGFNTFSTITDEELAKVNNFTIEDIDELLQMILENLKDISDLDASVDMTKEKIELSQEIKERLNYQKDLTKKEILEENILNIILMYHTAVLGIWITSPNGVEFLKKFIIVAIIGILSYEINANYFASDYHKQKAISTINEIDTYVELSKCDINNIHKFRDMYVEILKIELSKLKEFTENPSNLKGKTIDYMIKADRLLRELNLEYILDEPKVKRRIK